MNVLALVLLPIALVLALGLVAALAAVGGPAAAALGGLAIGGLCVAASCAYTVRQQHVAVVERLGRFSHLARAGLHVRVPAIDTVHVVSLMTEDEHITFDAKTADNVTVELEVSVQYHVDPTEDGTYKSFYTLSNPVDQLRDYLADALRSQVPRRTLEEVFTEKDEIASAVDSVTSEKMLGYGYVLVTTLITRIRLPKAVQESMNNIVASKNNLESATNDAEAARAKTVIAARAKAEAMEAEGKGIAAQRVAIARGIKDSIDVIQGAGMSSAEANRLFEYTQWVDMMRGFADGAGQTVVLPADFRESTSMFDQVAAARAATPAA